MELVRKYTRGEGFFVGLSIQENSQEIGVIEYRRDLGYMCIDLTWYQLQDQHTGMGKGRELLPVFIDYVRLNEQDMKHIKFWQCTNVGVMNAIMKVMGTPKAIVEGWEGSKITIAQATTMLPASIYTVNGKIPPADVTVTMEYDL